RYVILCLTCTIKSVDVQPRLTSFFFSRSRHHRDLHSFPTRRSSDLPASPRARCTPTSRARTTCSSRCSTTASTGRRQSPPKCSRSEEHTSELQSQSNLVCRLLLEKKNQKPAPASTRTNTHATPARYT